MSILKPGLEERYERVKQSQTTKCALAESREASFYFRFQKPSELML